MKNSLFSFVMVLALAIGGRAQMGPGGGMGGPGGGMGGPGGGGGRFGGMRGGQSPVAVEVLKGGIFAVHNGILACYDPATLKAKGTLELLPKLATPPAMSQNPSKKELAAQRDWMVKSSAHSATASMLENNGKLYLLLGTMFCRVNEKTLKLEGKVADLSVPGAEMPRIMGAPQLKMVNGLLLAAVGHDLVMVNPATLAVKNRATLPANMFPAPMTRPEGMGGGPGGGQGRRGGGGGGGRRGNNGPPA